MAITVTPYEPTDQEALAEAYRIVSAAQAADVPDMPVESRAEFDRTAAYPPHGNLTMIDMGPSATWHAWQEITIVDPPHRGHRLGLLVKVENLRHALAHEPELRAIDTWNAGVNDHMIGINEQLGFRPVDAWTCWQLTI